MNGQFHWTGPDILPLILYPLLHMGITASYPSLPTMIVAAAHLKYYRLRFRCFPELLTISKETLVFAKEHRICILFRKYKMLQIIPGNYPLDGPAVLLQIL